MLALVLAVVAATPAPVQPYPDVAAVQRIEFRSTGGAGLGTMRLSAAVIERDGGQLKFYGMTPASRIVSALLTALNAPAVAAPEPVKFGFANVWSTQDYAHKCLGDAADLPVASKRYAEMFANADTQKQWLHDYYVARTIFHTDDYPVESVKVTLADGSTISAESNSQTQYMLPFTVTVAGESHQTFDPRLSQAIADLSPGDVNADRLMGRAFFDEYGDGVCEMNRKQLDALVLATAAPALAAYVRTNRIDMGPRAHLALSGDLGQVRGEIRYPEWPAGLTFGILANGAPLDAGATQAAALLALRQSRKDGSRVADIPWLSRWLRSAEGGSLLLMPFTGGPYASESDEVLDEFKRHSPHLYQVVHGDPSAVLYGMLWDKQHNEASTWVFLRDGRSVLVEFFRAESTIGPLSKDKVVTWSAFARNEADTTYDIRATVTVLDPDGRVVNP